jgi:hypothetical protein
VAGFEAPGDKSDQGATSIVNFWVATPTLCVPVETTFSFPLALRRAGVPTELHVYAGALHGFGVRRILLTS